MDAGITFVKTNEVTALSNVRSCSVSSSAERRSGAPLDVIAATLKAERERAGLSLGRLAGLAGISKSTLSQLESGTGNPSIETLWALCVALDVPFSHIVDPPRPSVRLLRAGEGPTVDADQARYRATLLASGSQQRRDLYRVTAEPGTPRRSDPHMPGVVEHVLLCTGRALVGPSDGAIELHPGDFLTYPGDRPHVFEALEAGTSAMLASDHP